MPQLLFWPLMLIGIGLIVSGLKALAHGPSRPGWAMTYLVVFRRVVVGACFVGAAIGLAQQIPWLVAVSVCVGIGEFVESSYYISVMRWGQRRGFAPDVARAA
jgi:hypothetical protein